MPSWPLEGGAVKDRPTDQDLRGLARRGGEVEAGLRLIEKEGLPASGKAGGVLKGEYPNPEFAKEPAYKAELENETAARKEADTTEKAARESADSTEKSARETADAERVKGPASSTESDIATYNGATGKIIKDSGKTIVSVLEEAQATAELLASAAAAGLSIKNPVAYASTAALTVSKATEKTLEGTTPLEIDGAKAFSEGTRVLLKTQASEAQNGVYEVTTDEAFAGTGKFGGGGKFAEGSKWLLTRTKDADTEAEVKQGMYVPVTKGTTNSGTAWVLSTPDPIVIGTTAQTFGPYTAVPGGAAGGDLKGTYPKPEIADKVIVNGDVSDTAGIEYKKLELAGKLKGSDLEDGTVEGKDLNTNAKELFPQLPEAAQRDLIVGQVGATGTAVLGTGYASEKTGTGKYTIKLTSELATTAVCVASHAGTGFSFVSATASTKKEVKIENFNGVGVNADEAFNFYIFG